MHAIRFVTLVLAMCILSSQASINFRNAAPLPPMGWSTWNTFTIHINETLLRQTAEAMVQNGLVAAGYNYLLIDDGWSLCLQSDVVTSKCVLRAPRDDNGQIAVDQKRFPSGMKALADYVHSLGLKIGIYTAVSATTCQGYEGSLNNEAIDAQTWIGWGYDFIKFDTCNIDCGIHDGCIQASVKRMHDAIVATNKSVVFYVDDGNPTSGPRVYNPRQFYVSVAEMQRKVAIKSSELAWNWAPQLTHMWKSWFDRWDSYYSVMTNAHNQIRLETYQQCGGYNMPDMLTTGMGGLTPAESRTEMALWTILGAPLIIGCDVRNLSSDVLNLFKNKEMLAIDQDPDCLQGSMVNSEGATEVWIKTLSTQEFAVAFINKGLVATNVSLTITHKYAWGDFYPAQFSEKGLKIRDVFAQQDIPGTFASYFSDEVGPHDAKLYRMTPVN